MLYTVARRARLEDALAALEEFDPEALEWFFAGLRLDMPEDELRDASKELAFIVGRLKGLAGGLVAVSREMRDLEAQLGFGAKSMAGLGWKVEAKQEASRLDELRARRAAREGHSGA